MKTRKDAMKTRKGVVVGRRAGYEIWSKGGMWKGSEKSS